MGIDLIAQAMRGDFTGMNFAVHRRLSNESKRRRHLREQEAAGIRLSRPLTGLDIDNREEQLTDATRRIEAGGGRVVYVYDEPHTSAYKRRRVVQDDGSVIYRVIRPVYLGMLKDLARGLTPNGERLDGVISADLDRLTRDNRDLEDAIDVVTRARRPIIDLTGALDLNTDNGQTNARVIVAFKNAQSKDTARRVRNKHVALQREGIPTGGHRPFGWNEDKRTLHPVEAPLLQKAVEEILGGRSVMSVVADWNRRGITTARGKKWRAVNLKAVLRNPRMAGYRMVTVANTTDEQETRARHVRTLYDEDGQPVIGQWKRMISPEDWYALLALIGEAPKRGDGANTRAYLLTGTLRCSKCDTPLRATKATPKANKPAGFFWYTCPPKSQGGCGGMKINGPQTDDAVTKIVISKYEQEAAARQAAALPQPWDKEHELHLVREDIADAKAARRRREITAERYYADLAGYEAEEKKLLRERNAFIRRAAAATQGPLNLRTDWFGDAQHTPKLTLTEKRSHIERTLSAVIVHPATGRRNVWAAERIEEIPVPQED